MRSARAGARERATFDDGQAQLAHLSVLAILQHVFGAFARHLRPRAAAALLDAVLALGAFELGDEAIVSARDRETRRLCGDTREVCVDSATNDLGGRVGAVDAARFGL